MCSDDEEMDVISSFTLCWCETLTAVEVVIPDGPGIGVIGGGGGKFEFPGSAVTTAAGGAGGSLFSSSSAEDSTSESSTD